MFGIDAGGTYIKYGFPPDNFHLFPLPYSKEWLSRALKHATPPILVTGAGADTIAKWFPEHQVTIIPELLSTGLGGAFLSE